MLLPTKDLLPALINGRIIDYDVGSLNDQYFIILVLALMPI